MDFLSLFFYFKHLLDFLFHYDFTSLEYSHPQSNCKVKIVYHQGFIKKTTNNSKLDKYDFDCAIIHNYNKQNHNCQIAIQTCSVIKPTQCLHISITISLQSFNILA